MVYSGLHSYQERGRAITLFLNIFFVLFQHVEQVCKSFSKESLTRTSSSFAQCSACTFKFESVFSIVNKSKEISFVIVIFDIVAKTNRMWFSVALVKLY